MKWIRKDDWHWERECTRYTVSRSPSFAERADGHWVYLAWFRSPDGAQSISPEGRNSFEQAVSDCKAHMAERAGQQRYARTQENVSRETISESP